MKLTQFVEALSKRGIGEAVLRGGEPMQTRVEGQWRDQGAPIPAATLSAMIDQSAPADALTQWQSEDRCQFEHDGFLVKAARKADKIQIAVKRVAASTSPFADASDATNATSTTVIAPTVAPISAPVAAKAPLQPARVEWFYLDEGVEKGPIAPDRLRVLIGMGTIVGDTLVWSDGMGDWKPARDSDLRAMLPATALAPTPIAPPLSPPAPIAAPTGDIKPGRVGGGRIHEIPPSHDKFSLGAFMLPLFWCFSHNQGERFWPIFLTGLIPCVGGWISLYLNIQLAGEANSLAWAAREWDSVEHFEKTQRVWTIVGALTIAFWVGFFFLGFILGGD